MWNSDGSVILQAANTQFRVHWSVLARHSSVFRDMQGLPQPADQPTLDGCPVVELADDPVDVEYLLRALYIPTFYCQKELPLAVVGAFIRLGRKYDFMDLYDSAVVRLMSRCPTTLEEYDEAMHSPNPHKPTVENYAGLYMDIVALASQNHVLCVLPSAYYRVVRSNSLRRLFDGFQRDDGTTASLHPVNLRRCAIGQQRLLITQFQPRYTLGWIRKWDFGDCSSTSTPDCRTAREILLAQYWDSAKIEALSRLDTASFCPGCMKHLTECWNAGRRKTWDELPEIFGLPPWSELKKDI
ncbi:hypothetical protein DFH08DRAFT_1051824 [Mycena albidolilacea]|uniref:BTB domain-containing protein n=1 Tax=Mycena albidolilacea TaxID=1033008 RepID=A0AAD6Z5H1_9AGAR|nr:hypothetical protein DFH08DRAFT_1051824 [Mycena albidolilacea]